MTIISMIDDILTDNCAVPLPRYAQITGLTECLLYGVKDWNLPEGECNELWHHNDRLALLRYLSAAQFEIEAVLKYPLTPRWFVDSLPYTRRPVTILGKVVEFGVKAEADIALGVHAVDPSQAIMVFGPVATTVTNMDEIVIYHHYHYSSFSGSGDYRVYPSKMTISGGNLTIEIPRCRLVHPNNYDLDKIDNADDSLFNHEIDIVREYNDQSNHGDIYWLAVDGNIHTDTQVIYAEVLDHNSGLAEIIPATYSSGSYKLAAMKYCTKPTGMNLKYRAGLTNVPRILEDAVIRLAHSRMPEEPCGCDLIKRVWSRDRKTPEFLPTERLNCPFGTSDGAWAAWQIATKERLVRIGVL